MKALILALLMASPAIAQDSPSCGGFADMSAHLAKEYGETQRFVGLDQRGLVIVMTLNAETRSWTAMQVEAGGRACIVAAGTDGEFTDPPKPGEPT